MEILLIGNGFDLEHDLPTSYKNFLEFCVKARKIYSGAESVSLDEYRQENLNDWKMNDTIKDMLLCAFKERRFSEAVQEDGTSITKVETTNERLNELNSYISDNVWLRYFLDCLSHIGENWIDFESEISKVIKALDAGRFQIESGGSISNIEPSESGFIIRILKASKKNWKDCFEDIGAIDRFTEYLLKALDELIRSLEIYIAGFVEEIEITTKSIDIEKINPDHILSFNYSNTYERVYGKEKEIIYDYIHGKAAINKNVETSNLVLGIDEYLDDDKKDIDLEFLPFKKYYQRIYKATGNAYLDWVDIIKKDDAEYHRKLDDVEYYRKLKLASSGKANPFSDLPGQKRFYFDVSSIVHPWHTLYIFGHSLDVTDKDVLKCLICNDNVQTKIFYFRKNENDKTILGKLIKNLVKIIGQEELIRRTGGTCKTIEFIPQTYKTL